MKRTWKALVILFFSVVLTLSNRDVIQGNSEVIPNPKPVENILHTEFKPHDRGTWYLGAVPPGAKREVHPIVFVQGLKGSAFEWWGKTDYYGANDMYKLAYKHGYRTAFVQLFDKTKGPLDQWNNGELLARLLEKISAHFGGEKVNIIAHSKGGVDVQVAAAYYGAHRFVDKIITIASPHHGSHLANLFCSWYRDCAVLCERIPV